MSAHWLFVIMVPLCFLLSKEGFQAILVSIHGFSHTTAALDWFCNRMGMSLDNGMYKYPNLVTLWRNPDHCMCPPVVIRSSHPVAKSANSMSCYDAGFHTIGSSMCNRPDLSNLEASTPRLVCSYGARVTILNRNLPYLRRLISVKTCR